MSRCITDMLCRSVMRGVSLWVSILASCVELLPSKVDGGSSMKSRRVALLRADLGVTKTHSSPHVNDDNPFSESQFKTLKYQPEFPKRFGGPEDARAFCVSFFALVQQRAQAHRDRPVDAANRPLRTGATGCGVKGKTFCPLRIVRTLRALSEKLHHSSPCRKPFGSILQNSK